MSIVALTATRADGKTRTARFRDAFLTHFNVRWMTLAETKSSHRASLPPHRVAYNQFFTPPQNVGYALIVDVDRPEAVLDIYDRIPPEIAPSWVVPTDRGAQAGWFIDPVNLIGRDHPIRYARNVGKALRTAVGGDQHVDPLKPSRVRNPAYEQAGTFAAATPPVYRLGELQAGLEAANLWPKVRIFHNGKIRVRPTKRTFDFGERNQGVFDDSRFVAYDGGDYVAEAWAANDRCVMPLSVSEVNNIINSIARFMAGKPGTAYGSAILPDSVRATLSNMGRKGGLRNSPAQQAARAKGPAAAAAARKHRATNQARKAQQLRRKGYSRHKIAATLGKHPSTVSRYLQRWIPLSTKELLACITGASGGKRLPQLLPRSPHRSIRTLPQCSLQDDSLNNSESPPRNRCRTLRNPLVGTWPRSNFLLRRRQ